MPTMITSRSDSIHSRRACAKHDNVQIRLHPFPQSIHVPTMITSRSESIHSRRASMCPQCCCASQHFLASAWPQMLFYPTKHRVFRNCHTPKYVENPEGQHCCNFHDFLASTTWPQCYSIPQNTGCSYPLASAPCARERDEGA